MRIITDSSCDLNKEYREYVDNKVVPFFLDIGEESLLDDGTYSQLDILEKMKASKTVPKTAAPSPGDYLKHISPDQDNFIVTLSSKLSATYSNAVLAAQMAKEEGRGRVHVFDSRTASAGESLVAIKLREFIDKGLEFDVIVEKLEAFIKGMNTLFVLDSLENLGKNGRLHGIAEKILGILSIKPVMYAVDGEIKMLDRPRGLKRAHERLVEYLGKDIERIRDRTVVITHSNAEAGAVSMADRIKERYPVGRVLIFETGGLSTTYADDGGIIVSY